MSLRRIRSFVTSALALAAAACGGESGGGGDRASRPAASAGATGGSGSPGAPCARSLDRVLQCSAAAARPLAPARALPPPSRAPVVYYVDGSGSMTGYLDESFGESFSLGTGSLSFRRMLSQLTSLGGSQAQVFKFGNRLEPVPARSNQDILAQLVQTRFYTHTATNLEDVLDAVARDTARARTHIIITDGRRDDGASTMAQYKRVGEVARAWAVDEPGAGAAPGMFALAVASAPFRRVSARFGGCWSRAQSQATTIECPVYVMAFLPRAAAHDVLPTLRDASTRLFVAPAVTDTAVALRLDRSGVTGAQASALRQAGGEGTGEPLRVIFGPAPAQGQQSATVTTTVRVSADLGRSTARFSADDELVVRLFQAPLATGSPRWTEIRPRDVGSAWIRPGEPSVDDDRAGLTLPLDLRTRAQVPLTAYRIEVLSAGVPAWLGEYESPSHGDSTRTFGLSQLFEHLRTRPDTTRLLGLYGIVH